MGHTSFATGGPLAAFRNVILQSLLALCFISAASAQYIVDSWTTENGLPQNTVRSIQQTPDGYLWLATSDGLVRFDGVRFTVFNRSNSPELSTNRLVSLLAEKDGTLWICTETPDLVRYRDGQFQRFNAGAVWAQRDTDGSLILQGFSGTTQHLRDGKLLPDVHGQLEQHNIYVSPRGARWDLYGTPAEPRQTLLRFTLKGREMSYRLSPPLAIMSARMAETPDGTLWVAAPIPYPGRLYRIQDGGTKVYSAKDGLPASGFGSPTDDRDGHLWFGTWGDGICRLSNGRFTCYKTADGLSSDFITSTFRDREGTIWVGTNDRGLNRLSRRAVTSVSTAEGLPDKNIYPVLEDRAGDVWLGAGGVLTRIRGGRVMQSWKRSDGWLHGDIQSLYEDHLGRLWIGGTGIQYYANGRFTDLTSVLKIPGPVPCQFIHEDSAGAMWFGTSRGLIRYQDGQVTRYTVAEGLPGNDVKAGLWARDGTFWVGTYGGLARLDGARFVAYTERDGLASNHIRALYEDEQGTLWIGTYDGGLSRLRNGKFFNYTTANGLFSNGVFAILDDSRGNFWMSSNQGIYRVSRRQLDAVAAGKIPAVMSTAFGRSDGMLNTECNGGRQPSGLRTRDGKLWFPTQDGVAVVDPEAVPYNALPPPVVIESAEVQRRSVPLTGGLRLKSGEANLEIRYTGLSLVKPEQVRFRYRLEPLDEAWVDAGTRRAAFYPYLPPGHYTFRVIAANSDLV